MAAMLVKGKTCSLWDLEVSECGKLDGKLFMVVTKNHGTSFMGIEYQDGKTRTFDKVFPGVVYAGKGDLSFNLTFPQQEETSPVLVRNMACRPTEGKTIVRFQHRKAGEGTNPNSEQIDIVLSDNGLIQIYANADGMVIVQETRSDGW